MQQTKHVLSLVLQTPAASPLEAQRHFSAKLTVETDVSDVRHDLEQGCKDFILVDVRSAEDFAECHIPEAINLPHRIIDESTTAHFSKEQVLVLYCWGPACNGATKAAAKLSTLGFRIKEMLGGIEYWRKEGGPVEGTLKEQASLVG